MDWPNRAIFEATLRNNLDVNVFTKSSHKFERTVKYKCYFQIKHSLKYKDGMQKEPLERLSVYDLEYIHSN